MFFFPYPEPRQGTERHSMPAIVFPHCGDDLRSSNGASVKPGDASDNPTSAQLTLLIQALQQQLKELRPNVLRISKKFLRAFQKCLRNSKEILRTSNIF